MVLISQQYETNLDVQYKGNSYLSITNNISIMDSEEGNIKENNNIYLHVDGK